MRPGWTTGGAILLQTLAFGPIWPWLAGRIADSDEHLATLAAVGGIALVLATSPSRNRPAAGVGRALPALGLLAYAGTFSWVPTLVSAGLAVATLATTATLPRDPRTRLVVAALAMLALPIADSLQFVAGYPLRAAAATIASGLLRSSGIPVGREGTLLDWGGELVSVDVACSGARMLRTTLVVAFTLAGTHGLGTLRTTLLLAVATAGLVVANGVRASALFFLETGWIDRLGMEAPEATHEGVGALVFVGLLLGTFLVAERLRAPVAAGSRSEPVRGPAASAPLVAVLPPRSVVPAGLLAALVPLLVAPTRFVEPSGFPGWPERFEGRTLVAVPLTAAEVEAHRAFPGRVARFVDGDRVLLLRWIAEPTRRLHATAVCLAHAGWAITPAPVRIDEAGSPWGCSDAHRDDTHLRVCAQIVEVDGEGSWTDASSWIWAAWTGRSSGPWWAVSIAEARGAPR